MSVIGGNLLKFDRKLVLGGMKTILTTIWLLKIWTAKLREYIYLGMTTNFRDIH
jgi:hypothetical protein